MTLIVAFIVIILLATLLIPLIRVQWKGVITVAAVIAIGIISSIFASTALMGKEVTFLFQGLLVTGKIPVRIDALSGWFILVINFTCITGAVYGMHYMKAYKTQIASLSMHCVCFILVQASLISICSLQNMIAFLIAWEIMALSSFILVIFEHDKRAVLNAGINFLIQSHICILFLTLGFLWVAMRMDSYDFIAIRLFSSTHSLVTSGVLFGCFFAGFAIKSGFVPFHTWLPYAHPAAPAHVSGVMSGVIIKIGIYGILRMLLLVKMDYQLIGYLVLFMSIISGIYGVMLAIIQHNLKRLLAYHSIENIGIIGIGIGLGCIGMGSGNQLLTTLGFGGALLHTLNHSLFKSLLFYGAGNVYQATHTLDIEKLGGIGKQMPHTAWLFLIAALAICGLPPFNGFVSEFLIYNGMFAGLHGSAKGLLSFLVFGLFALSIIGGLAMLCFTKAFGAVFLGTPRHQLTVIPGEAGIGKLLPMYAVVILMIAIGLYPSIFLEAISKPVGLFNKVTGFSTQPAMDTISETLSMVGIWAMAFVFLTGLVYFIRWRTTIQQPANYNSTWGCGYVAPTGKMQYTASSFIRGYRKLAEPMLSIHKKKKEINAIFPTTGGQETLPYDLSEKWLIDYPLTRLKTFLNRFVFLQNGNLQFYILYGIAFITLVLVIPMVFHYLVSIIHFLKTL